MTASWLLLLHVIEFVEFVDDVEFTNAYPASAAYPGMILPF
jgi:hypothetical protein